MQNFQQNLKNIKLSKLKQLCKQKKIKNYSKLSKPCIIKLINYNLSIVKIQRFLRKKWIDGPCPITLEVIKYPCWAFKPKGFQIDKSYKKGKSFIYYDLNALIKYLLTTGDFRDPKTREPYTPDVLKSIDLYKDKLKLKYTSLYKASINKSKYKKKKDREEDIIVLEMCIDEVVSKIRFLIENEQTNDCKLTLNNFHFPTFHRYFRNLLYKSRERAKQDIHSILSQITINSNKDNSDPNNIRDFILQFLYTIQETYGLN